MKKGMQLLLVLVMVVSILGMSIVGCAKEEAPAPATPTPATPTLIATMKFTFTAGPPHPEYDTFVNFKQRVEEQSGGRIKIDLYPSASLVKEARALDSAMEGVADLAQFFDSKFPDRLPLAGVWALPPIWSTSQEATRWQSELLDEFFKEEAEKLGVHTVFRYQQPSCLLFLRSTEAYGLEDIKGLSIRSVSPLFTECLTALDTLAIHVPFTEIYDALQKGMIEGAAGFATNVYTFKWQETGKPGYIINMGGLNSGSCSVQMNQDVYDSLPSDLQEIINEAGREGSLAHSKVLDGVEATNLEKIVDYGATFIQWDDAEIKRVRERLAPMWDDWANEMDSQGLPGSELAAAVRALAGM